MTDSDDIDPAMGEAVDWVVRLSSGEATDEDVRALELWRAEKPEHDAAFRRLARLRPISDTLTRERRLSRRALLGGGVTAIAAIGAVGIVRPPLGLWPSLAELMADHRTGPGQRYAFAPVAGVRVEMNSRTSLDVLHGDPGISLIGGEAFVSVQRENAFRLVAGEARFRAAHASVNLETLAGGIRLACIEGTIECRAGQETVQIGGNQQWRLAPDGRISVQKVDAVQSAGWRNGVLRFTGAPLGEVVEQLNRYRTAPIMLAGAANANRPVSAIFYTAKTDAAVVQLEQLLGLPVRSLPGGVVLLG